jgi:hypothetical protein
MPEQAIQTSSESRGVGPIEQPEGWQEIHLDQSVDAATHIEMAGDSGEGER